VKTPLPIVGLRHLNAEIGMPISGIEMVAIRDDFEIQISQQVFPEREWLILGGEVNADVPES